MPTTSASLSGASKVLAALRLSRSRSTGIRYRGGSAVHPRVVVDGALAVQPPTAGPPKSPNSAKRRSMSGPPTSPTKSKRLSITGPSKLPRYGTHGPAKRPRTSPPIKRPAQRPNIQSRQTLDHIHAFNSKYLGMDDFDAKEAALGEQFFHSLSNSYDSSPPVGHWKSGVPTHTTLLEIRTGDRISRTPSSKHRAWKHAPHMCWAAVFWTQPTSSTSWKSVHS